MILKLIIAHFSIPTSCWLFCTFHYLPSAGRVIDQIKCDMYFIFVIYVYTVYCLLVEIHFLYIEKNTRAARGMCGYECPNHQFVREREIVLGQCRS
jgi:hypothetical protein